MFFYTNDSKLGQKVQQRGLMKSGSVYEKCRSFLFFQEVIWEYVKGQEEIMGAGAGLAGMTREKQKDKQIVSADYAD